MLLIGLNALTAVKVDEKHPFQMPVVDECRMHARARLMVDGEVTDVWVPPEQIILLFINDQFLQRDRFSRLLTFKLILCAQNYFDKKHTIRYKWEEITVYKLGLQKLVDHLKTLSLLGCVYKKRKNNCF